MTERTSIRSREEILKNSPFLKAFLDSSSENDPDIWRKMIKKEIEKNVAESLAILDEQVLVRDINDLYAVGSEYDIVNPEYSAETHGEFIFFLACIGREVGKKEEIEFFREDIIRQLVTFQILEDDSNSRFYVDEALGMGIKWIKDVRADACDEVLGIVEKLDLSNL